MILRRIMMLNDIHTHPIIFKRTIKYGKQFSNRRMFAVVVSPPSLSLSFADLVHLILFLFFYVLHLDIYQEQHVSYVVRFNVFSRYDINNIILFCSYYCYCY